MESWRRQDHLLALHCSRACWETVDYAPSQSRQELLAGAQSHGWTLDGIEIVELVADESELEEDQQLTMLLASEIELEVLPTRSRRRCRAYQSEPHGVRFALGAAAPRAELLTVSASDSSVEAAVDRTPLHRTHAG